MYEKKSDFVSKMFINYFQRNKRGDIGDSDYAEEIPNVTRGYLRKVVQRNMNFNNLLHLLHNCFN